MTYFEVLERDGPGRIGELDIDGATASTPALAIHREEHLELGEIELTDSGTLFHPVKGDVAPGYPSPQRADRRILEGLAEGTTDAALRHENSYSAAAVNGGREEDLRREAATELSEAYRFLVVGSAPALNRSARELVETVSAVREAAREDTAIYAPGLARPWSIPLLVYAGIDVLDDSPARIAAARGTYLGPDGAREVEGLEETPCSCMACRQGVPTDFEELLEHNRGTLKAEVGRTRSAIRRGRLRELVEQRTRTEPWLVSALRHLDRRGGYLQERTPSFRKSEMTAYGDDSLRRQEVKGFAERMHERFSPPESEAVVVLPCSAGKPYSLSRSHRRFRGATKGHAWEIILTSPMGAVPRELEMVYPAAHYDVPVTGDWSEAEVEWMATNLKRLLEKTDFDRLVAHVEEGGYTEAVERVEERLGVETTYTSRREHPLSRESMERLKEELRDHRFHRDRYLDTLRSMVDYQLGAGTGESLEGEVTGRYPTVKLRDDEKVVATAVPDYGAVALTLEARDAFPEDYVVKIDDFVPMGSVLAPGVIDGPETIRPGDEVLVEGPSAVCVGRARMSGREMTESERGVAVDVRHREEL